MCGKRIIVVGVFAGDGSTVEPGMRQISFRLLPITSTREERENARIIIIIN